MTDRPDVYRTTSTRIELDDPYDVLLWAQVLGVTPQTVLGASLAVGTDEIRVQAHLRRGVHLAT